LILQTSDGVYGSHAVTTWNEMIFDSNSPCALRWSQRSLDWCSGQGSTCVGFSKVYRLCPPNLGRVLPGSTIRIGTQVRSPVGVSGGCGWVKSFPTWRKNGQQKKGFIIFYTDGTWAEMSHSDVSMYALKR
jgi:hypothetical protein